MRELVQLLEDVRARGFSELAGSRVEATLAIAEPLVNRAIGTLLAEGRGMVRGAGVHVEPGERFNVRLHLAKTFVPSIGIEATIERQPELPVSPVIIFKWRTALPGLASFAGMAASFFRVLPPGIRLEGDRLFLDLQPLLARAGAADLLPLLSELRITTRAGVIDLRLAMNVGG
jgi:hypothetical protein